MLGVADLHTHEAVAAAESAISSRQRVISLPGDGSEVDSDEESSYDDDVGKIDRNVDGFDCGNDGKKSSSSLDQKPVSVKDDIPEKQNGNCRQSNKQSKRETTNSSIQSKKRKNKPSLMHFNPCYSSAPGSSSE